VRAVEIAPTTPIAVADHVLPAPGPRAVLE